jgi:phenylpyruvate tautomerase PptA (4-oxalocrotonate tautomerase family)
MPILDIEMVVAPGETVPAGTARTIADATGTVFGADAGTVWVKIRTLPGADYAENGVGAADNPAPVFVRVLKRNLPEPGALRVEAARLAEAIAKVCGRPVENVHILYEPPGAGRVAFGGELVDG